MLYCVELIVPNKEIYAANGSYISEFTQRPR